MAIIKQSLPKTYMNNLQDLLEEDEFSKIGESDYYSECCSILINYGLLSNPFDKIFDYFMFKFSVSEIDCSKEIKNIIKSSQLNSDEILIYIKNLDSKIIKECIYSKDNPNIENLSSRVVVPVVCLNSYKLFLMYCFDLVYSNKKLISNGLVCKYSELDNVVSLLDSKSNLFSDNVNLLLNSIESNPGRIVNSIVKTKYTIGDKDIALFQKIKFKYDFITIQYLIKNLLVDESTYYNGKLYFIEHVIGSLMSEIKDNEFNVELTSEFYSLLKKRAYLLPRNGVSINPSSIEFSMDLFERQLDGDNYLCIVTNVGEQSFFTFINLNKEFLVNNSPFLYDTCNFLYSLYKLEDYAIQYYGKNYAEDPRMIFSYKSDCFISTGISTIKGRSRVYEDFTVEVPYYWRYKDKSKSISPSQSKREFIDSINSDGNLVYVSAFKRRLPSGQKASSSAKQLAKLYCIELEGNETLVSPFVRIN